MIRFLLSQATALAGTLALAAWTHCEGLWTVSLSIGFALALLVCLVFYLSAATLTAVQLERSRAATILIVPAIAAIGAVGAVVGAMRGEEGDIVRYASMYVLAAYYMSFLLSSFVPSRNMEPLIVCQVVIGLLVIALPAYADYSLRSQLATELAPTLAQKLASGPVTVILRSEQFKGKRVFFVASRKEGGEARWKCSSSEVELKHLPAACR